MTLQIVLLTLCFFLRNGTSFVSLYIPAKEKLEKINQMLTQELAGAESIKSRQTRQSVIQAITSTKESKSFRSDLNLTMITIRTVRKAAFAIKCSYSMIGLTLILSLWN